MEQMKKAKKKSTAEKLGSFEKPVLRSESSARARSNAKLRVVGSGGLRSLFEQAAKKAASLSRHRFKENWPYLQTMLRLVGAHERREYRQASDDALLWIVVAHVVNKTRKTLAEFMIWETAGITRLR
jgi:hypothetical protein